MSNLMLILAVQVFSLPVDESRQVSKIAFGSCTGQFNGHNQQTFKSISDYNPDLFIWLGDAVYADEFSWFRFYPARNLTRWKGKYDEVKNLNEYQELASKSMITGVWDDHDYGTNNGGKGYEGKFNAKSLYLDFLQDGSKRNHEGIYHSFAFKDLKVILIDIRWFRDEIDQTADDLGEEQWKWIEEEMKGNEKVKILASGLQVNTFDRKGPAEKWHEATRVRLWEMVEKYHGVVLLSGDVHYAEMMKVGCVKRWIYEVTSSGMSHTVKGTFNWIGWSVLNLFQGFNFNIGPKIIEKNFGSIEIDWKTRVVTLNIRDSFGKSVNSHSFNIEELYQEKEVDDVCRLGQFKLKYRHFGGCIVAVILPVILNCLALLIFLRKYTNSY